MVNTEFNIITLLILQEVQSLPRDQEQHTECHPDYRDVLDCREALPGTGEALTESATFPERGHQNLCSKWAWSCSAFPDERVHP